MLNIITACVRPQNLGLLHQSILRAKESYKGELDIVWYICLDVRVSHIFCDMAKLAETRQLEFQPQITTHLMNTDLTLTPVGTALTKIKKGLVCVLDDDNLMHENFIKTIYPYYLNGIKGFLYHQLLSVSKSYNQNVRFAKTARIRPGSIDTAQFCFDRELIEDTKWEVLVREPDGLFISTIYNKHSSRILILDEILCYFNALSKKFKAF